MKSGHHLVLSLTFLLGLGTAGVQAQIPKGSEIRINQRAAGVQRRPDVATAADGRFVVVWEEGSADPAKPFFVKARLFDAVGRPRGGEIQVARQVNTFSDLVQASVAMAPDGRFVVVWGAGRENPFLVFGRRYDAEGRPLGPRFRLSTNRTGQNAPDVAMAADGSFVAAWGQRMPKRDPINPSEISIDVFFRRFGPDGRPLGPEAVAIDGYDDQGAPQVALQPDGGIVIASHWYGSESSFYDVAVRLFSPTGDPLGDQFLVNGGPNKVVTQHEPALAMAADGSFAVAWTDWNGDFGEDPDHQSPDDLIGVAARLYAADGTPLGEEREVNIYRLGAQRGPALSALPDGGFLMLWSSGGDQDGDEIGIFGRQLGADGEPRGRETRFNLQRAGTQWGPSVSIAPNGKGVAVWYGPDGDGTGIFARLIGRSGQGS